MSALKTAALAAAVLGGTLAAAEAQPYGHWGYGQGWNGGYHHRVQPPVYVHPRIARKQAQLQERFVEKYGVVRPWGHYRPNPYWRSGEHVGPRHYDHIRPRPRVQYHYGW